MCNAADNCATLTAVQVNLGASDVAATSFQQQTHGWINGDQSFPTGEYIDRPDATHPLPPQSTGLRSWNPIVVPFGFLVNNTATEYVCVPHDSGSMTDAEVNAYPTVYSSCVPDSVTTSPTPRGASGPSSDCLGYFSCVDSVCAGGLNDGDPCAVAADCPDVALSNTYCKEVPIQKRDPDHGPQHFQWRRKQLGRFWSRIPELPHRAMYASRRFRNPRHHGSGCNAGCANGWYFCAGRQPHLAF